MGGWWVGGWWVGEWMSMHTNLFVSSLARPAKPLALTVGCVAGWVGECVAGWVSGWVVKQTASERDAALIIQESLQSVAAVRWRSTRFRPL